jgi:hypothetical protein
LIRGVFAFKEKLSGVLGWHYRIIFEGENNVLKSPRRGIHPCLPAGITYDHLGFAARRQ